MTGDHDQRDEPRTPGTAPAGLPGAVPLSVSGNAGAVAGAPVVAARPEPATEQAAAAPRAADPSWSTAFGATNVAAFPSAVAVSGETVYLGGDFITHMAGMPDLTYNRIARWDGVGWNRMSAGLDAPVRAIAVVGKDVFVGGEFSIAGDTVAASRLARWDGTAWAPVAGGVEVRNGADFATVRALASDGRRLYVAGTFDTAGVGRRTPSRPTASRS